jgi:hypothetical protein
MTANSPHDVRPHLFDLWNPVVHLSYLGDPVDEVITLAEADGWAVWHINEDENSNDLPLRARIRTLEARPNELPIRSRGGRVVGMGQGAYVPSIT